MRSETTKFVHIALFFLSLIAACRPLWSGIAWDGGNSFDPRERELAQLSEMIQSSDSIAEYLDPLRSRSNLRRYETDLPPAAYSSLLLLLPHAVPADERVVAGEMARRGRVVSALFATGTTVLTGLIAWLLFQRLNAATFAILLLGGAVLQIRSAHYFLPEAPLTFAATLGLLGAALFRRGTAFGGALCAGLGVALSCAIDPHGVLLVPTVLLGWLTLARTNRLLNGGINDRAIIALCAMALIGVIGFRVLTPYAFAQIDGIGLDGEFFRSMLSMLGISRWESDWVSLEQRMLQTDIGAVLSWGVGIPLSLAILAGMIGGANSRTMPPALTLWIVTCCAYALMQPDSQLLMMTALLPVLCIFGGAGLAEVVAKEGAFAGRAVALILLLWAAASGRPYSALFGHKSTLLQASTWIEAHVPTSSSISTEQGDIRLPAAVGGRVPGPYRYLELRLFCDNPTLGQRELDASLVRSEFHISSSQYPELLMKRISPRERAEWHRATVARDFFKRLREEQLGMVTVARFAPQESKAARLLRGSWLPLEEAPAWLLRGLAPEITIRKRVREIPAIR